MKKIQWISVFLCLSLLLQCLALPVSAAETTTAPETEAPPQNQQLILSEDIPFGQQSIQQGCRTIEGMSPLGGSERRLETAQGVFLYEINSDTVVYSYNPDTKLHPGPLAKLVLALIVLEHCEMEDMVTVVEGIQSYLPMGAHNIDLKSFEKISVGDLLYAVMLTNANDAAVALAVHVSGSTSAFLTLMNDRVKQMGCVNTEFGNISGLYTAQSYSTARDIAKIVREAIKNEDFRTIFGTATYTLPPTNEREKEEKLTTQSYLMDNTNVPDFYDTRVSGSFACYHETTGASLAYTVSNKRGDMEYIGVILGAMRTFEANGWKVISWGNFNEATDLIKYGFDKFKVNRIIYDGMSLSGFAVSGGESNVVGEARVNIDSVVPISSQMENLRMSFKVTNGMLTAPIKKGDVIATMSISYLNSVLAEAEVYAMSDVKAKDQTGVTIHGTASRDDGGSGGFASVLGTICVIILGIVGAYLAYNSYMRSRIRAQRRRRRQSRRRAR